MTRAAGKTRIVMKFGGTSLADVERIQAVAARVKREIDAGHDRLENAIDYEAVAEKIRGLVGAGHINHYNSTGTLLEQLNTTSASSEETGMCFDGAGNLYTSNFSAGNMSKFNNAGGLLIHPWAGPFSLRPESCVADATGNTVYTFSNLNVYKSTNYAGSWSALPTAPITTGAIRGVGVAKSNGSVLGVVPKYIETWPASKSVIAAPPPLYGT